MLEELKDTSSFLSEFEEENKTPIIKEGEEEIENPIKPPVVESDEILKNITHFETEEVENDEVEEVEDNSEVEEGFSYKAFLSHLNEEGVVSFEDSDDVEDKVEVVYESISNTIKQGINSYKESIPETGKKFLEYLEKGGDVDKFIETLSRPLDLQTLDLESEADQEKVVREFLKNQDYSADEINETITDYKDSLILDKQAKVASKKLEKTFEKRNENLLREQEELSNQRANQINEYINAVSSTIDNSTSFAGLEVPKAEKDTFKRYLLARDKEGLTAYEKEIQEDPIKTQLELAYLKFKKFDFGAAKKQGETEATKKLNWKLKTNDGTVKGGKSTDRVKNESDFSAFEMFKSRQK